MELTQLPICDVRDRGATLGHVPSVSQLMGWPGPAGGTGLASGTRSQGPGGRGEEGSGHFLSFPPRQQHSMKMKQPEVT